MDFKKTLLFSSLSLRVLDVLKFIHSQAFLPNIQEDIRIDEQEINIESISGNDKNEIKQIVIRG